MKCELCNKEADTLIGGYGKLICDDCWKEKYMEDNSKTNPELHMLYTKWACKHLRLIDKAIKFFGDEGNLNLLDIISACQKEREKLIKENVAYFDADEILKIIEGTYDKENEE